MRLLRKEDIVKAVDKHIKEDGTLDNDISCILGKVKSPWIKCNESQMPEDLEKIKVRRLSMCL